MLSKIIGVLVLVAAVYGLIGYVKKESKDGQCAGCSLRNNCTKKKDNCTDKDKANLQ